MLEIIALLLGLFFLALPFLIIIIFQKINRTDVRIKKLNERVDALSRIIAGMGEKPVPAETLELAQKPEKPETEAEPVPSPEEKPALQKAGLREPHPAPPAPVISRPLPAKESAEKMPAGAAAKSEAEAGWRKPPAFELHELIKAWLLGGNTLARVGVVILFFGVAFFLKYAVDRGWFPIEMRLMAAAIGGVALIALGWRLRPKRHKYALALQGGGIGIVYLTVFAAVSQYELIASVPGLGLMVVLVVLASALAVLQDARSLAVLACVGGFLAPVLISRDGSHVTLFSYYAILNVGILAIAWFRAWRELNLIGFVFTFVIASVWGYRYYQPAYFSTVQPFLVLFFLFYVAVPVLFAQRQPPDLKGYIDGSLIFGVPLVGFGLQSALVRDFEYGLAVSAVIIGLFYVMVASVLLRRRQEHLRMLVEVFISLAVAFGTVAIPLAVDGRWTGAAWALEGAALVWIGIRQQRRLARIFGIVVQLGAGAAFLIDSAAPQADVPILNSFYLSALMIAIAGLFSAFQLNRFGKQREPAGQASAGMLIWGLLWWFGAGINEIRVHVDAAHQEAVALVFVASSLVAVTFLRRRLAWQELVHVLPLMLPSMYVIALLMFADTGVAHPFAGLGLPAWLLAFTTQYGLLRRFEPEWQIDLTRYWHLGTFWLLVFIVTWEVAWLAGQAVPEAGTWRDVMWAFVPAAVMTSLPAVGRKLTWPIQRFDTTYLGTGLVPLVGFIACWTVYASFQAGDPSPLPYVPVVNPHELTQLFILVTVFFWLRKGYVQLGDKARWYSWSAVAFLVLNGIVGRAVHFYGDVPFTVDALWHSPRFQASVSIIWTLAALLIMVAAARLKQRLTWVIGSALLAAVVVKLFLVDLADIGTVARIISFIVVGLLILLIGYVSPMPPKEKEIS